jgi:hypothetical protein
MICRAKSRQSVVAGPRRIGRQKKSPAASPGKKWRQGRGKQRSSPQDGPKRRILACHSCGNPQEAVRVRAAVPYCQGAKAAQQAGRGPEPLLPGRHRPPRAARRGRARGLPSRNGQQTNGETVGVFVRGARGPARRPPDPEPPTGPLRWPGWSDRPRRVNPFLGKNHVFCPPPRCGATPGSDVGSQGKVNYRAKVFLNSAYVSCPKGGQSRPWREVGSADAG